MRYDDGVVWAMAHSKGEPRPFICGGMTAYTRRELIDKIEKELGVSWRKWSRKYGVKIVRVRVSQIEFNQRGG